MRETVTFKKASSPTTHVTVANQAPPPSQSSATRQHSMPQATLHIRAARSATFSQYSWPTGSWAPIVTPYSPGEHNWNAGHRGVDLAVEYGATIYAAASGEVIYAGTLVDREIVSIEDARGIRTTYEPISPSVRKGDHVERGDPIGTINGYHCGVLFSCLHWGAKRGTKGYMNPMWLIEAPAVRLYE